MLSEHSKTTRPDSGKQSAGLKNVLKLCHKLRSRYSRVQHQRVWQRLRLLPEAKMLLWLLQVLVWNTEYNQSSDITSSFKISLKRELLRLLDW